MEYFLVFLRYRFRAVSFWHLVVFRFFVWGWTKSEIDERKVDAGDDLPARVLDAAARTKKHEDKLRRIKREFRTRIAK
jgi:hypothetical protein